MPDSEFSSVASGLQFLKSFFPWQAAYDFTGYHTPKWVAVVYATLVFMTGGLVWVVVQCLRSRPVWTMQQCTLKDAQHVQVKVCHEHIWCILHELPADAE